MAETASVTDTADPDARRPVLVLLSGLPGSGESASGYEGSPDEPRAALQLRLDEFVRTRPEVVRIRSDDGTVDALDRLVSTARQEEHR